MASCVITLRSVWATAVVPPGPHPGILASLSEESKVPVAPGVTRSGGGARCGRTAGPPDLPASGIFVGVKEPGPILKASPEPLEDKK